MNNIEFIKFLFNKQNMTFSIIINLWSSIIFIFLFILIKIIIYFYRKRSKIYKDIIPVKLKYSYGGAEIEYKIIRNYINVEIAHKIYIELITRKAAIPFDEKHDIIVEVYNSWYTLFDLTRNELKSISGKLLLENNTSNQLVILLTDILNNGLRPHLTKYQAAFRKWYAEELEKKTNKGINPQDIQKKYKDYNDLINSIKDVNTLLIEYKNQLNKIIHK